MPSIQTATTNDITELTALLTLLFTQEAEFSPNISKQQNGLKKIIENPEIGHILVLKKQDKIIGMVNLVYTISTALGGRVAMLEDMIIRTENRGKGEGSSLLKAAIDFAKQKGCLRITLLTDLTNEGAIKFYKKHGFTTSAMTPLRLVF